VSPRSFAQKSRRVRLKALGYAPIRGFDSRKGSEVLSSDGRPARRDACDEMRLRGAHAVPTVTRGDVILPSQRAISIDVAHALDRDGAGLSIEESIAHCRAIRTRIEESMTVDPAVNRAFMGSA